MRKIKALIAMLSISVMLFSVVASSEEINYISTTKENISVEAYTGEPSTMVNNNIPFFTEKEKNNMNAFESYSKLDGLGRCGITYANVCQELMPTQERESIGSVKPSGWHTVKYNGIVDGNYLYNRCHLIGFQLTGENANKKNLITGTRYMNVVGMLPYENMVAEYVRRTNNHVLYRVTPIFTGNNLICDGVMMEAYSVEDNGSGITFCVFVYNVQPGIYINYSTGESCLLEGEVTPGSITEVKGSNKEISANYVLNTNTKKFHKVSCDSVNTIKEKNKQATTDSRENIIAQGYAPCKKCNP